MKDVFIITFLNDTKSSNDRGQNAESSLCVCNSEYLETNIGTEQRMRKMVAIVIELVPIGLCSQVRIYTAPNTEVAVVAAGRDVPTSHCAPCIFIIVCRIPHLK